MMASSIPFFRFRPAPARPQPKRRMLRATAALADRTLPDRGCSFIFHRAVRSADWASMPNRRFHVDIAYLERLLVHLRATGWDIVTMDEALRRVAQPGQGRFVNFSVDDCYRDTAEMIVPLFHRLGAPVTLYVTTGIPDRTLRMRDAGLETILQQEASVTENGETFPLNTPEQKRTAYATLSARWQATNDDAAYLRFCARHGYDADALDERHAISWPMLEALRASPFVEIGAHTVSHRRIAALEPSDAFAEILHSRERLEQRLGRPVRHFAFPYGLSRDCGPRDFALARQAGFASASTTVKGLIAPGADPWHLPRHTLNGAHRRLPLAYAHLTGLTGLATRVLRRG